MQKNFMDEVEKKFISFDFIYEKSFDTPKRTDILKEILDEKTLSEIFSKNLDLLKCGIVLSKVQEQHLFRKYNYLKYRISKISKDKKTSRSFREKEINKRISEITRIREIIIKCNLRLIVKSVCKLYPKDTFNYEEFFSNGYLHMLRAIDHFDYTKNFKFSTYFVNVLYRNLYRDKQNFFKNSLFELDEISCPSESISFTAQNEKYNIEFVGKLLDSLEKYKPKSGRKNSKLGAEVLKKIYGICGEKKIQQKDIAKKLGLSRTTIQNIVEDAIKKLQKMQFIYDPLV